MSRVGDHIKQIETGLNEYGECYGKHASATFIGVRVPAFCHEKIDNMSSTGLEILLASANDKKGALELLEKELDAKGFSAVDPDDASIVDSVNYVRGLIRELQRRRAAHKHAMFRAKSKPQKSPELQNLIKLASSEDQSERNSGIGGLIRLIDKKDADSVGAFKHLVRLVQKISRSGIDHNRPASLNSPTVAAVVEAAKSWPRAGKALASAIDKHLMSWSKRDPKNVTACILLYSAVHKANDFKDIKLGKMAAIVMAKAQFSRELTGDAWLEARLTALDTLYRAGKDDAADRLMKEHVSPFDPLSKKVKHYQMRGEKF